MASYQGLDEARLHAPSGTPLYRPVAEQFAVVHENAQEEARQRAAQSAGVADGEPAPDSTIG